MKYISNYCIALLCLFQCGACKKYLDVSPSSTLAVPSKLGDLQAMMDENFTMNANYPYLLDVLTDDIYLTTGAWKVQNEEERAAYIWEKTDRLNPMYSGPYMAIYKSNLVLEELDKLNTRETKWADFDRVKGSALFYRAAYYYGLSQLWAFPYYTETAGSDPGIPLRLTSDISTPVVRPTVADTYEQILTDLKTSAELLPDRSSIKTRPSRAAAFGWLARTYLQMHQYDSAGYYAGRCLSLHDSLINFNTEIDVNSFAPFQVFNKEVIFHMCSQFCMPLYPGFAKMDSLLFSSYSSADLRKQAFFYENGAPDEGTFTFKGDYTGNGMGANVFSGIVTDEQYLIRAEAAARLGHVEEAMDDLNTLLANRYDAAGFVPFTATDADDALIKIIEERRKELLFRGVRWSDLRRLTQDERFAVTLIRNINGQGYTLSPGSDGYILWFPKDVIELSGITQNP